LSELADAGSIASILGAIVGIGAIVYAYYIKRQVNDISKRQKENAQGPYKINTSKNMNEIHGYFRDIIRITKNLDPEKLELEENMDYTNVTSELDSYYNSNKKKMISLLEKTIRDLGVWYDLDKNIRPKFEEIIENFQWLTNEFFESNKDQEMQTRIWTDNYDELLQKKYKIEQILDSHQKTLA